jgi:outer membrane protein TolC
MNVMRKWCSGRGVGGWSVGAGSVLALALTMPSTALAQQPAPPLMPPAPPTAPSPLVNPPPGGADDTTPLPVPNELMQTQPGGITADQAGARAAQTSWDAKASMESLRSAEARVDGAWSSFLPRLSALGKYTRLSNFNPPPIAFFPPGTNLVVAQNTGAIGANNPGLAIAVPPSSFPFFVLDNWLFQGTLSVPISDYFLRINQNYNAVTHSEEAARWDVVTARAASEANGRIAYYTWLNARGAVVVAVEALNDQKTHLRDARNQFAAGNASKADVLRAETAAASAELALEHAKNLADLSEKQLRVAIHASEEEPLKPGEDIDATPPPVQGNLKQMTAEALSTRPEVKSADANAASAHEQAEAQKAANWPVLSAFGDGILGNPNPRYIPPSNVFNTTWDVGAQVTWSPNDILTAKSNTTDFQARVAAIIANRNATRDNIEVEVTQMYQNVREADFAIDSSTRELASATEAYRVARELFNNGRGTSTTLTDAESELTRARLDLLNAKFTARTARIRLEHALGRDAHAMR